MGSHAQRASIDSELPCSSLLLQLELPEGSELIPPGAFTPGWLVFPNGGVHGLCGFKAWLWGTGTKDGTSLGLASPSEKENSSRLKSWGLSPEWLPQAQRWALNAVEVLGRQVA